MAISITMMTMRMVKRLLPGMELGMRQDSLRMGCLQYGPLGADTQEW
jgi:hypothetical protein